ncbi:MAG TPA: 1-acyl-sn-glycerol-3-phosphate acyltransferase, partial [Runella sp.]|nr:1-acyl-sn-glycerol-3-phosphate acyltransferase [Runella sp.]
MKKIIDYVLGSLYLLYFGLVLVIFHPIQMVCFHLFGRRVHQKSVHVLNGFLLHGLYILGTRLGFQAKATLPTDRPVIFIANHQSMFDIVGMIWFLRKNFPLFVSKKELAKGIPSISYNLQKSGAALIDRQDGKQAIMEIARLAKLIEETKFSAAIFPEGTRSRTGAL